ncbi:MAG: hypothetical protein MUQ30_09490 [Anaerolineae bacterium]|nr:hypothetical protein [Anaerolineae bacterium]
MSENHGSGVVKPPPATFTLGCRTDGRCCMTDTRCYPRAYPTRVSEVKGWGEYDGMRQWYKLGGLNGPETAWEVCFADGVLEGRG